MPKKNKPKIKTVVLTLWRGIIEADIIPNGVEALVKDYDISEIVKGRTKIDHAGKLYEEHWFRETTD